VTLPDAPKSIAMPNSKNPDAVDERIRYFKPASRDVGRSTSAHKQYSARESSSRPRKTVIRFAAPAISIAPLVAQSTSATTPPMRSGRCVACKSAIEKIDEMTITSCSTTAKPPRTNPPSNASCACP
jgi:hypothetical protein